MKYLGQSSPGSFIGSIFVFCQKVKIFDPRKKFIRFSLSMKCGKNDQLHFGKILYCYQ